MNELFDAAASQFKDRIGGGLKVVEVPEWPINDEPAKIYYKPAMTFKQQNEVLRLQEQGKPAEAVALTFVLRALNEDGKPLFTRAAMGEIMKRFDPEVVSKIVTEMADDLSDEDMEKN